MRTSASREGEAELTLQAIIGYLKTAIAGDSMHQNETRFRAFQAKTNQGGYASCANPVTGLRLLNLHGGMADANAGYCDTEFQGKQLPNGFVSKLACGIAAVWPWRTVFSEAFLSPIKPHGVHAAGEHHASNAMPVSSLENIDGPEQIGTDQRVPGCLLGNPTQMNDGFATSDICHTPAATSPSRSN